MKAIVEIGGKEFLVEEESEVLVPRLKQKSGEAQFQRVKAILGESQSYFGTPYVQGASVEALVVEESRGKKVRVFKYKPKVNVRRQTGQRKVSTKLRVLRILAPSAVEEAPKEEGEGEG